MAANFASTAAPPGQPWFLGAPLTKVVTASVAISFVLIELKKAHGALAMDVDKIINDGQYYRLVTGHVTFGTAGELIMGTGVLCLLLRRFEREMGSRKMAAFFMLVGLIAVPLIVVLSPAIGLRLAYAGPYPWLGALIWLYHYYTPRMHPRFFGMLGFHFSEKSVMYTFCLQVVCCGYTQTIFPSSIGFLAGCLLCTTPLANIEIPSPICSFLETMGERVLGSNPPPIQAAASAGGTRRRRQQPNAFMPPPQPPRRPSPPPEAAVEQLTSMGFEREAVLRALGQTNNNVERAADRLLVGG